MYLVQVIFISNRHRHKILRTTLWLSRRRKRRRPRWSLNRLLDGYNHEAETVHLLA